MTVPAAEPTIDDGLHRKKRREVADGAAKTGEKTRRREERSSHTGRMRSTNAFKLATIKARTCIIYILACMLTG